MMPFDPDKTRAACSSGNVAGCVFTMLRNDHSSSVAAFLIAQT